MTCDHCGATAEHEPLEYDTGHWWCVDAIGCWTRFLANREKEKGS